MHAALCDTHRTTRWTSGMLMFTCVALLHPLIARGEEPTQYAEARARMVSQDIASSRYFGRRAVKDKAVLTAMGTVPRHRFVPERYEERAYTDQPLPIGYGQTISQPYIVALMTEALRLKPDYVALEIGTGSGYQAAVLAQIVKQVYTIEIVEPLAKSATQRLSELGYDNIKTKTGDGYFGWKEHAPYDAIIVTAAASHVPPPLVEQLKPGGRMVIPVGPPFGAQTLFLLEKNDDGSVTQRSITGVRFVPLTRGENAEAEASSNTPPTE